MEVLHSIIFTEMQPKMEDLSDRRVKVIVKSVVDTFCKFLPICPTRQEISDILDRHLQKESLDCSNRNFQGWLHDFKNDLEKEGHCLRVSTSDVNAEDILRMSCGNNSNKNQVYRSQTLSYVLKNLDINWQSNTRLKNLLPKAGDIRNPDNSEWCKIQGVWIIRMFYCNLTNGLLVSNSRCAKIWEIFNAWEKKSGIPPQLVSLKAETLSKLLPTVDVVTCEHSFINLLRCWEEEMKDVVLEKFSYFPFCSIDGGHGNRDAFDEEATREIVRPIYSSHSSESSDVSVASMVTSQVEQSTFTHEPYSTASSTSTISEPPTPEVTPLCSPVIETQTSPVPPSPSAAANVQSVHYYNDPYDASNPTKLVFVVCVEDIQIGDC